MRMYEFEGHTPKVDPEAFIAPTATLIGEGAESRALRIEGVGTF
jgi:carbonic anhydrase/acetyltransferase-like protein (isoleucine patch superfamily)